MKTFLKRLKEPSTWAGLAALGVAFGLDPAKVSAVTQAAVAVAGSIAVVLPESTTK